MALDPHALSALVDILKPADADSDSDEDKPTSNIGSMGPGNIGPEKKTTKDNAEQKSGSKNSKDIWEDDEVQAGAEFESTYDPRPQPEYDIVYKQAVTSEDMFLQMGNKNPATASCEDMLVKIKLPDTKIGDVELDVKVKFLDCRTPKYYLGLHLPHPVDHKNGKAQWDGKTETLTVNLRLVREYDFMNF